MKAPMFLLALVALAACTTKRVELRTLAPDRPAETNAAAAERYAAFAEAAKAATETRNDAATPPLPQVTPADAPSLRTYDPWERMNRFTYRFNARFDEAVFFPVANAYRRLPLPLQRGAHNFFANLAEVDSVINYALQGRLVHAARSIGRFLVNSTVGVAGLFDVAAKLRLPAAPTGLGTTLAKWGMRPGPYLVIPFVGPSTLRDGVGFFGDIGTSWAVNVGGLYDSSNRSWALGTANAIDQRANVDFRYYETGSAFEYEAVRFLYVRKRLIEDEGLHAAPLPREPGKEAGQ
ncbi:MAG: VacJ family lipoprotein [Rudaea sp.]|uniref:MlaA family lipoprotein n=1 Tax=Rudaea sp. TaxID=2136325 RepID=UPI0039E491DC